MFRSTPIPLNLYDRLRILTVPHGPYYFPRPEKGLEASIGLLSLVAPCTEDTAAALRKEKEVFTQLLEFASVNEDVVVQEWARSHTSDVLCRFANLRRLACTEAPETVVQVIHEFGAKWQWSTVHTALLSAIQHDRVELMKLLLTTFPEQLENIYSPLREVALHYFPALFRNNPILNLSPKEILSGMQAPTPENRRSNYDRVVIAVKNGHPLLAAALLRDMRPPIDAALLRDMRPPIGAGRLTHSDLYPEDLTLYSCLDPSFAESMQWLPLGSTEQ